MNLATQIRFLISLATGVVLAGIGCSSNSQLYYSGGGTQCDGNASPYTKPVDAKVDPSSPFLKVSTDPNANDVNLPEGEYLYQGANVFFFNSGDNQDNFLTILADNVNPSTAVGQPATNANLACIRNFFPTTQKEDNSQTIVTHLSISGGKQTIFTKSVGYKLNDRHLFDVVVDPTETQADAGSTIDSIFKAHNISNADLFKVVTTSNDQTINYQLFGSHTDKINGTVQVLVSMQWNKPGSPGDVAAKARAAAIAASKEAAAHPAPQIPKPDPKKKTK